MIEIETEETPPTGGDHYVECSCDVTRAYMEQCLLLSLLQYGNKVLCPVLLWAIEVAVVPYIYMTGEYVKARTVHRFSLV